MIRVTAPAKVNLHLGVGPLRADGYHELTSVFHTLTLADELTVEPADALALFCDEDLGVPAEKNLAYRAAVAFGEVVGRAPEVRITLLKRIPHGAGLGGGSSDAAAVLVALAERWSISHDDPRLGRVAASLGADVPFFLIGGAALMVGRGDEVARELPTLAGAPVALVRPPRPVPTVAAYRAFDAAPVDPGAPDAVISALEASDADALAHALYNNLEVASSAVVAEVAEALAWVRESDGVSGAIVAGSGSAVFALCASSTAARELAERALARGWWSAACELAGRGATATREG